MYDDVTTILTQCKVGIPKEKVCLGKKTSPWKKEKTGSSMGDGKTRASLCLDPVMPGLPGAQESINCLSHADTSLSFLTLAVEG